jgi:hypothetical protein
MAKQKILLSRWHDKGYWTHGKNAYKLEVLPIKKLWASVPIAKIHNGVKFYDTLKDDMKKNGMINPLLVVTSTQRELLIQKHIWKDRVKPLPFSERGQSGWQSLNKSQYVIWGGSNRVCVAEELGYTHIECCMMLGFKNARAHQKVHREPWNGVLYK